MIGCILFACNAQAAPGSALRFDGVNGYVQVTHSTNLNAYPLTATAWFRTTNGTAAVQGIVSKYTESSGNGWGLVVQNGHLRGFHSRRFYYNWLVGWVTATLDATSAVSVADGFWHQAVLVINDSGETLYLDGLQAGSSTWTPGFPGPQTSTDPLQIGGYSYYPNRFLGDIDEVTVWNRSLGVAEINYLKHRRLNGNEDGLVALWHFDENGGISAGDATGHGYLGTFTLVNSPAWVASSAPLVFNQVSSNALKFDGINGYVQVAHTNDLNSYPFTSTGWFRTTNAASVLQGIVSKCVDGIANGWALGVDNGHLRGFFYINGTLANNAIDATSAASVADGSWHHAALVVDGSGGKLFLDGNVVGSSAWSSPAGAPTTTDPLLIGRYSTRAARFLGDIDEVTVWNRALAATEVQSFKNLRLAGAETGLVAYWRFDEGLGTSTADATGHGHAGTFVNGPGPIWTGSTAFLGDGTSVIHTTVGSLQWSRQFAVQASPTLHAFQANAPFWLRRLDDFGAAGGTTNVSVALQYALQSALLAGPVPLANNSAQFNLGLTSYNAAAPQASAGGVIQSPVLDIEPQSGTQLDSVNDTFQLGVTEAYSVNGGAPVTVETTTLAPAQLLHFNGNLFFGPVLTRFTSIANSPTPGGLDAGGLDTLLGVNNNSGFLPAKPDHTYGNGTLLNVILYPNGDALTSAAVTLAGPVPDLDSAGNISFVRTNLALTGSGIGGSVTLNLPTGFSVGTNTETRITTAQLAFPNIPLDPASLMPTGVPTVSVSLYNALYGVEETKPFWIRGNSIEWHTGEGTIVMPNPSRLVYVHRDEDALLAANQASLVDTNAAYRVSNDGYYANASPSGPVVVRADSNGAALLSMSVALPAADLHPHFPYISPNLHESIPSLGGLLVISNGLVDTTASFLNLAGPVPVSYNRDCADTNCSASFAGTAELWFTANANQANQLFFTPDGGLLASGAVPAQNLTWGSVGNNDFAQRTSDVGAAWFHMPGTFLRGDQTGLADALRPVVILFSGFGDATDRAYVERPGMANYSAGWANYAGVNFRAPNFRAPAQGRSIIAGQATAWYPLIPQAKYYARLGGVSGIHQAATFPANLTLYGYAFTFSRYALSYLDSENWQSLTDGSLVLPYPSGFTQEFAEMKFLCRGELGSARVPASSGSKLMQYWQTAITPQTVEFRPTTNDTCSLTTRYLVLGVETKLPLIPQAFHALLGFQTNGNLATADTKVEGVDSRFAVPPEISLQGSGNSHYTFATAGEGYFNNWEAASNTPGFFNLVGRIKFPFFVNSKTHLHVEPTGTNVFIMGGWPSPDLGGTNYGWNDGSGNNFFNTAKFDTANRGFPVGVKLTDYRRVTGASSLPPGLYRPRAQRDWIEVAKFDYSLQWKPLLREFASYEDALVSLPMIDVYSHLKVLTPGKVDLDFAQDISLSLPHIKLLDLANDALGEINLPLNSVQKAVQDGLHTTLNVAGFNSLQRVLRDQTDDLLRPVLGTALAGPVTSLYNALSNQLATLPAASFPGRIVPLTTTALSSVGPPQYVLDTSSGMASQLRQAMTDVNGTLAQFLDILKKDGSTGSRPVISRLLKQIAGDQGFAGVIGDAAANDLLKDLEPTLAAVESRLREVQAQFNQLQSGGQFGQALGAVTGDGAALNQFVQLAGTGLSKYLSTAVTPAGDFFTANPAAAQAAIREQLIRAFLGSPLAAGYQQTIKQLLYEEDALLTQLMDTLFQQINQAIREGISAQVAGLAGASDLIPQPMKGPSSSLAAAQIRGMPTFDGDALKKIRLDAKVQISLPDQLNFNAYMEITELDSTTTPLDCIPAGDAAAEIKIGALDVPLDWTGISQPGKPMTVSLEAKWTQQNGNVLGVGGMLDIKGEIGFKGCSVDELGATLAIGALENYFAAKAAGSINVLGIPVDLQAGVFVGKTCSLAPLKLVDPECGQVLGNPAEFAGIYVAYGASLSLSEIIFRTSSCMLDIDASVSSALFYEGGATNQMVGMRQKMALEVSLLCLISGHVDWAAFSSLEHRGSITDPYGYTLTMGGSANLCGKIGACPFCLEGCKGITIKGTVNTGGVDYYVDY